MSGWDGIPEHWGLGKYRDVPVSQWVLRARERQVRDLKRARDDPTFPYYFDDAAADHAVDFFHKRLRHTQVGRFAGKPFILSAWQEWDFIRPLFGWKRKDNGMRRFRRALLLIARKNGKTTLAAGIALYLLSADNEPAASGFCVATKEEQAGEVFEEARRMAMADPLLRKLIKPYVNKLTVPKLNARLRKRGADTSKKEDGHNAHFAIVDEYHAHPDNSMLSQMEQACLVRDEPLIVITSTAGDNDLSPCKVEQDYAQEILLGEMVDEEYFVYVCTPDSPENWEDEAEWYRANPQLGLSIELDAFRSEFERAKAIPSRRNTFLIKHLNIWTTSSINWMPIEKWDDCGEAIDWRRFDGQPCVAALDMGRTQDLTALALAFKDPEDEKSIALQLHYWMPLDQDLELRERSDAAPYREWIEAGLICGTEGASTDDDVIFEAFQALREKYEILRLAGDKWSAAAIFQRLEKAGVEIEKHPQTALAFRAPIDEMEKRTFDGRLRHGGHPVLRYNVRNAVLYQDSNANKKFDKKKSRFRIDGLVASTMAVGLLTVLPPGLVRPYKKRGIRFL